MSGLEQVIIVIHMFVYDSIPHNNMLFIIDYYYFVGTLEQHPFLGFVSR